MDLSLSDRIALFQQMISDSFNVGIRWIDCAKPRFLTGDPVAGHLFFMSSLRPRLMEALRAPAQTVIVVNNLGIVWALTALADDPARPGRLSYIAALGPICTRPLTAEACRQFLQPFSLSIPEEKKHLEAIAGYASMSYEMLVHLTHMMYSCVHGGPFPGQVMHVIPAEAPGAETIRPARGHTKTPAADDSATLLPAGTESHAVTASLYENHKVRMIEEGNLFYLQSRSPSLAALPSTGRSEEGTDPVLVEQEKLQILNTLCSRAAIRGGLDPNIAYFLFGNYSRAISERTDLASLDRLAYDMQADYLMRVHDRKAALSTSRFSEECKAYVSAHTSDPPTLEQIASHFHYSPVYVRKKFRQETGQGLTAYIHAAQLASAADLLCRTHLDITTISEHLGFSSPSNFATAFRKQYGVTPSVYRAQSGT